MSALSNKCRQRSWWASENSSVTLCLIIHSSSLKKMFTRRVISAGVNIDNELQNNFLRQPLASAYLEDFTNELCFDSSVLNLIDCGLKSHKNRTKILSQCSQLWSGGRIQTAISCLYRFSTFWVSEKEENARENAIKSGQRREGKANIKFTQNRLSSAEIVEVVRDSHRHKNHNQWHTLRRLMIYVRK